MARCALLAVVVAALLAAAAVPGLCSVESDVVQTSAGTVSGLRDTDMNVRWWRGVPFGESTAGPNRFAPPVAKASWEGVLNTTAFGPGCPSLRKNADEPSVTSEDCLNLDVYAPLAATTGSGSPVPVVIWIYGGSFAEGSNEGPFNMYDARYLAANFGVIYVTINYRLGALGFMVTPEASGNYGFQDQQLAMKWVQQNIAAFGGDPTQVTLQGESAGAMSIGLHLISPYSMGLFNGVILESNPVGLRYVANDRAVYYGLTACQVVGCNTSEFSCDMSCMQQANLTEIELAWKDASGSVLDFLLANWGAPLDGFLNFKPTVDGDVIPGNVLDTMATGKFAHVPVLIGTNTNEGDTFIMGGIKTLSMSLFDVAMWLMFGTDDAALITGYYGGNFTDGALALSQVFTDFWFRCSSAKIASYATSFGQPAYVYRYAHIFSDPALWPAFGLPDVCADMVCHATEVPFVFHFTNITTPVFNATFTPAEVALSTTMNEFWTTFAKTGNPNPSGGAATWPVWSETRQNLVLDETLQVEDSVDLCEKLWDLVGYDH